MRENEDQSPASHVSSLPLSQVEFSVCPHCKRALLEETGLFFQNEPLRLSDIVRFRVEHQGETSRKEADRRINS